MTKVSKTWSCRDIWTIICLFVSRLVFAFITYNDIFRTSVLPRYFRILSFRNCTGNLLISTINEIIAQVYLVKKSGKCVLLLNENVVMYKSNESCCCWLRFQRKNILLHSQFKVITYKKVALEVTRFEIDTNDAEHELGYSLWTLLVSMHNFHGRM